MNRLPGRWDNLIILEKTERQNGKKGYEILCKAPYMLITEVKPEKILKSLKSFNEIRVTLNDIYNILNVQEKPIDFLVTNIAKIQEVLKRQLSFT